MSNQPLTDTVRVINIMSICQIIPWIRGWVTYLTMGRTTPLPSVAWPFQLRAPTKYTWGPSSPTTTGARLPDSELTQVTIAEAFHIYIIYIIYISYICSHIFHLTYIIYHISQLLVLPWCFPGASLAGARSAGKSSRENVHLALGDTTTPPVPRAATATWAMTNGQRQGIHWYHQEKVELIQWI
jgi:hypothetical protein